MERSVRICDTFLEERLAQMGVQYEGREGQSRLLAFVLVLSGVSIALAIRLLFPHAVP